MKYLVASCKRIKKLNNKVYHKSYTTFRFHIYCEIELWIGSLQRQENEISDWSQAKT